MVYNYPEPGDQDWGSDATDWAAAVTTGMLQKSGGLFQLLAEVDFGTAFGVKALYLKSRTSNVASAGQIRLARADVISFRNQANDGNLDLGVSTSNVLQFNGADIQGAISVSDTSTIDLTLTGTTLSADIIALSITDALISASAAISFSKLAALTSGNILVGSAGNVATSVAMSGDATIIASGAITIANSAVTNAKMANMAESTIKGRAASSGTGAPVDLSATQATAILNNMVGDSGSGGTKGLAPAPAAGDAAANKFLKADGTWSAPAGAGDVVGPASATDNAVVVYDGTTGKLIKNSTVTISSGALTAPGALRSNASLILEDPGAGTNTFTQIAGTVSSSYSITWPAAVAAASNSVLVSSDAGVISYAVAASANTASAIVQRDGSGNFTAGTITAALTGTASGNTTYTANQYGVVLSGAANVMTVLAPNASTVLPLISGGASADPAWGVLAIGGGGTGQTTKAPAFDALSPMSAGGDLIYGGASGTGTRLPNGSAKQVLTSAGGTSAPTWVTPGASQATYKLRTPTGYASTNNHSYVFATTDISSDPNSILSIPNSASLGAVVTALKRCRVTMTVVDNFTLPREFGITKNASLTTDLASLSQAVVLVSSRTSGDDLQSAATITTILEINDYLNFQNNKNTAGATTTQVMMYVFAEEI